MKLTMTSTPVFVLPNFEEDFILEMDSLDVGISAFLLQREHHVSYFSKKLSLRMQKTSAYVWELYVISKAIKKWRQYFSGRRFIIRTYQKSLCALLDQVIQMSKKQHYLAKLFVDALSRQLDEMRLQFLALSQV